MCEGELRQIESRGNYDLTEDAYFKMIAGKTALLVACCCRLGAHYADAEPAVCEALAQYGHDLGVAFQIADDVLDLTGDQAVVGKSLGTDLLKQKATLPIIHLLNAVTPPERSTLVSLLMRSDAPCRDALQPWLERYDAVAYARRKAEWFTRQAGQRLSMLPASAAVDSLRGLTDFVVRRHQ